MALIGRRATGPSTTGEGMLRPGTLRAGMLRPGMLRPGTLRRSVYAAVGVLALLGSLAPTPVRASARPAYGPGPGGCPSFVADGQVTLTPDGTTPTEVGPFSSRNTRVLGIGMDTDGVDLVATVQVEHMARTTAPGFRWAYWLVYLRLPTGAQRTLHAYYDRVTDSFTYATFLGSTTPTPLTGEVKLGDGGGVSIRIPLAKLGAQPGDVLTEVRTETGDFISYVYMSPDRTSTWPSGVYFEQWRKLGHAEFPLIPCPGVLARITDLGGGDGVLVQGYVLPDLAGLPVSIERFDGGSWQPVEGLSSKSGGWFSKRAGVAAGTHQMRVTVTTPAFGPLHSAPVTVTATA